MDNVSTIQLGPGVTLNVENRRTHVPEPLEPLANAFSDRGAMEQMARTGFIPIKFKLHFSNGEAANLIQQIIAIQSESVDDNGSLKNLVSSTSQAIGKTSKWPMDHSGQNHPGLPAVELYPELLKIADYDLSTADGKKMQNNPKEQRIFQYAAAGDIPDFADALVRQLFEDIAQAKTHRSKFRKPSYVAKVLNEIIAAVRHPAELLN